TAGETYGFYVNSPFFTLVEGFNSQRISVIARYPNTNVVASGWLKGEELMAGRAAIVSIDMNPGRIVLSACRRSTPRRRMPRYRCSQTACIAPRRTARRRPRRRSNGVKSDPVGLLVTGGTFDKEYNELTGTLVFKMTHLPEMLRLGRSKVDVSIRTLMMVD